MTLGPFLMLTGAVAGALLPAHPTVAIAAGVGGLIGSAARRRCVRAAALLSLATGIVMYGALPHGPSIVERLAGDVPVCDFTGRVGERVGTSTTLISVQRLRCNDIDLEGAVGVVAVDGFSGDIGGLARGRGRLFPLGKSRFDAARRRAGADAGLDVHVVHLHRPGTPVLDLAARLRGGVSLATSGLEARRGALVAGLTIGDTSQLDHGTQVRMRRAGLAHLVAVSGSNVAIVVGAAMLVVRRAGRFASVATAAFALLIYAVTVGPEPSVLRASAMGAISLAALVSGQRVQPLAALCVAVSLVLALRPEMIHSVGLQLSAAATAGLILWSVPIADRFPRLPRPVALGLGATSAANLAVAPILIGVFGELSLASPIANLAAMAAVPPATILGLAAGVAIQVNVTLGSLIGRLAEPFSGWILLVGDVFGAPAPAAVHVPKIAGVAVAIPIALAAARPLLQRSTSDAVVREAH